MSNNKYTPETIDKLFSIPLYQRLFEWEVPQIKQLLNDLYASFKKNKNSPYYIGLFTVASDTADNRLRLVDGQQRFTVLTLIGIVLKWQDFLTKDGEYRLAFFARKRDEKYLQSKIHQTHSDYVNRKMEQAIEEIDAYLKNEVNENDLEDFKKYIYTKTTFFISFLPTDYTSHELNRYFEAMNEAGKGLENHEILKVLLLQKAPADYTDNFTRIWNSISEMDRCLIRPKENELKNTYKARCFEAFENTTIETVLKNDNFSIGDENFEKGENSSIKAIKASQTKPKVFERERGEKAILSFSDFLLQVLWLSLDERERKNSTDFFNINKLLETFEIHVFNGSVTINDFFSNLLKYRLLLDYYVIRLNSSDNRNTTYSINFVDDSPVDDVQNRLWQYQSMLYVSTQSYLWLTPLLEFVNLNTTASLVDFLDFLKKWDDKRHSEDFPSLYYGKIDRYWFWRLDYYLWENRAIYFKDKALSVANKYLFKINRSIEHVAPRQPKNTSSVTVSESLLHSYGNLAMISAGQNSSLQNESFELKRAHVESLINGSNVGSIESLKLLCVFDSIHWNEDEIINHHNRMINVLIESFPIENSALRNHLSSLKK